MKWWTFEYQMLTFESKMGWYLQKNTIKDDMGWGIDRPSPNFELTIPPSGSYFLFHFCLQMVSFSLFILQLLTFESKMGWYLKEKTIKDDLGWGSIYPSPNFSNWIPLWGINFWGINNFCYNTLIFKYYWWNGGLLNVKCWLLNRRWGDISKKTP